jgi:hypothetical protein
MATSLDRSLVGLLGAVEVFGLDDGGGGGTVTGTASITLGAATVSSAGSIAAVGTASITLGALTGASAGTVAASGTASITLGSLSLSSVGYVVNSGAASITLGTLTSSATGLVVVSGFAANTLAGLGILSAGLVTTPTTRSGSASITLGLLSLDAVCTSTMPTRTLAQLRDEVRQRANMENADNFITDAEIDRYVNQSICAWRDMLVENRGQDFFTGSTTLTLTGASMYALPADYYQILNVSYVAGGVFTTLTPYNRGDGATYANAGGTVPLRYRVANNQLFVLPSSAQGSLLVTYVPLATTLTLDSDTIEVFNGWEEWIVLDAAMKALEKEATDTTQLFMRREVTERRLMAQAQFNDRGFPESVADVRDVDLSGYPW